VIPPLIRTDLTYHYQKKEMRDIFSEQERDHYITMGEIGRIRKEIERENIRLDSNDATSTRIWVETLQSEGHFLCYKDKLDRPPDGSNLADDMFFLCIQMNFQRDAFQRLGNAFLGVDATHNCTQYDGILLFTMMARDHWGKGT
jgi:hypothetical protein